jgi:gluconokinase
MSSFFTKPHAIVVIGVAGSGKTTVARALAEHYGHAFLDADDFHTSDAKAMMAAGVPLTDDHREPWVGMLVRELRAVAQQGRSSVLAFSGLRAMHRQRLRDSGVPMRFVFLHAPPSVIAERLAARNGHFMPPALLASQFEALEPPSGETDVIDVDVDGTPSQVLERVVAALETP